MPLVYRSIFVLIFFDARMAVVPAVMVPGTAMGVFPGVSDRDKDDIVAYVAAQK
jgi:hypothetical protein